MKRAAIVGTFDTKGEEYLYIKQRLEASGLEVLSIHTGSFAPRFTPDIDNCEVAAAGGVSLEETLASGDRATAIEVLSRGLELMLPRLYKEGRFEGVLALGGSGGTAMTARAMRALPLGVPKLIVSTVAAGETAKYIGESDLILMPSVVDIAGLNRISRRIFDNAASSLSGMLGAASGGADYRGADARPCIAATMYGVTTPCVDAARKYLEGAGFEVIVFHATGAGGRTMERLVREGFFEGVLDITTTEWPDELFGGIMGAGAHRCEAAPECGVPFVMSVGACDIITFGEHVPQHFLNRTLYHHNSAITLMRTNAAECDAIGRKLAEKLALSRGPAAIMLPMRGVSLYDAPGRPFYDPEADEALFAAIRDSFDASSAELICIDCAINDGEFALAAAKKLEALIQQHTLAHSAG